jgi:hypothetical protein
MRVRAYALGVQERGGQPPVPLVRRPWDLLADVVKEAEELWSDRRGIEP